MKIPPTLIFLALILISCKQPRKIDPIVRNETIWTSDSIKKYFRDSIAYRMYNGAMGEGDSLNNFENFSRYVLKGIKAKNISNPFILGFDEDYIDTTKIDPNRKWFRITVDPCFRIPYCLILEEINKKSVLTLKMTDGYGGYYSGNLNFLTKEYFSDTLYSNVSNQLHHLGFWNINEDTTCKGGMDGETWTFEAMEKGKYNAVSRWVPLHCGNTTTRLLAVLGVTLRNKARFKEYIALKTEMNQNELKLWYPEK